MADAKTNQYETYFRLPELRGTPKQVKWARSIRVREIGKLREYYPELSPTRIAQAMYLGMPEGKMLRTTDAAWWIDFRGARLWAKLAKDFGLN